MVIAYRRATRFVLACSSWLPLNWIHSKSSKPMKTQIHLDLLNPVECVGFHRDALGRRVDTLGNPRHDAINTVAFCTHTHTHTHTQWCEICNDQQFSGWATCAGTQSALCFSARTAATQRRQHVPPHNQRAAGRFCPILGPKLNLMTDGAEAPAQRRAAPPPRAPAAAPRWPLPSRPASSGVAQSRPGSSGVVHSRPVSSSVVQRRPEPSRVVQSRPRSFRVAQGRLESPKVIQSCRPESSRAVHDRPESPSVVQSRPLECVGFHSDALDRRVGTLGNARHDTIDIVAFCTHKMVRGGPCNQHRCFLHTMT